MARNDDSVAYLVELLRNGGRLPSAPGHISLTEWNIVDFIDEGFSIFIGLRTDRDSIRTSTAIVRFDDLAMKGETESGSVYTLIGDPAMPNLSIMALKSIAFRSGRTINETELLTPSGSGGMRVRYLPSK